MAEQDRSVWDAGEIAEGVALITGALPVGHTGPYQLQAAIAVIHNEVPTAAATDWPQIAALYDVLLQLDQSPVIALNHAVAVAMFRGPQAGLDLLAALGSDTRVSDDRRFHAVSAHLQEMSGDRRGARASYEAAERAATNLQQRRYLHAQAARLDADAE